ncbi:MAG: hypothetical protein VX672_02475, partial [Planctomycetota bacterium]|nr:hypothetical protein [Planctomycetota bacterium]
MSREPRSARTLRLTGALVLGSVLGLGYGASRIPKLLRPPTNLWTATLPISTGADGMAPGSLVQVVGFAMGEVTSVVDRPDPAGGDPVIEIEFELDATVPLSRDARIRRSVGIAGTDGVLDVLDPGRPGAAFAPGERRSIPIELGPRSGGSFGLVLGRSNGVLLQRIGRNTSEGQAGLLHNARSALASGRVIEDDFERLLARVLPDVDHFRNRGLAIQSQLGRVVELWSVLVDRLGRFRAEAAKERITAQQELAAIRRRFERVEAGVGNLRNDVEVMSLRWDGMRYELQLVRDDLLAAQRDAAAIATRTGILTPEVRDGLARSMARMVLAGGQLKRAIEDLLPLAIDAVTTRPNRASESRRRLHEATD